MRKDRVAYFKKQLLEKQRQLADEVGKTAMYGKDLEDDSIKDLRRKVVKAGGDTALLSFPADDLERIDAQVFRCPPHTVRPGPAYSGQSPGMSTFPYVAYVGRGKAANISAYWRRTAPSTSRSRSSPVHSPRANSRASAKRRAVRSSTMWSAFSTPKRSGKMPRE